MRYIGRNGELNFEEDFIKLLQEVGWESKVIKNPTEKDLIENWKQILFENNKKDLNNIPLSDTEMEQIINHIRIHCTTPDKSHHFINGENFAIKRDNDSADTEKAGKEIYLTLYNRAEIGGGNSRYQIVEQPQFLTGKDYRNRRGDVLLLINGMPVIHIELKAKGVDVLEATTQFERYAKDGVFTSIFSLIQVFFAMTPEDALYFANPGDYTNYNPAFFFRWGDKDNNVITDWRSICKSQNSILSIPEAHKLIGYYTVANKNSGTLMVIRPYQYQEINAILNKVQKHKWGNHDPLGGYIWCTTGGGKTLTSFKSGQLMVDKSIVDKVVFVVDRRELDEQSYEEYMSFSRDGETIEKTENTDDLFTKLKSSKAKDSLILTSIQKLMRINDEAGLKQSDLDVIKTKRVVFIIDEAHRSQFGEMHKTVKKTFVNALFIGFSGTPIKDENNREGNTTESVFGECLASYTIAEGIRDNNVLGFDPKMIKTFSDAELKEKVALQECKSSSKENAMLDPEKWEIYLKYTKHSDMVSKYDEDGNLISKGIEDFLKNQYNNQIHRNAVVNDIINNWDILSIGEQGTRFHAILATKSITEACQYYKLFKEKKSNIKITTLFNSHFEKNPEYAFIQDTLIEILNDYNQKYDQSFNLENDPGLKNFKRDVMNRLSHKKVYKNINPKGDNNTLDLVIVVNMLLTGFDSKFVNTLYLDQELETDKIIQAISRTNRVYNAQEKPFGIVRCYRKPYTMERNIYKALELYCEGNNIECVLAKSLNENITEINEIYTDIKQIFENNNIEDFRQLPRNNEDRQKFKKEFYKLNTKMNSIKLQGFKWDLKCEECSDNTEDIKTKCEYINDDFCPKLPIFTEEIFSVLKMRFEDLPQRENNRNRTNAGSYFEIVSPLSEIQMEKIDADYIEKHFKLIKPIFTDNSQELSKEEKQERINQFKKEFAKLPEKLQVYAEQILADIESGNFIFKKGKKFTEYVAEYKERELDKKIEEQVELFGVDKDILKEIIYNTTSEKDLNEYGRFVELLDTRDCEKTKKYFSSKLGKEVSTILSRGKLREELREFIFNNRF